MARDSQHIGMDFGLVGGKTPSDAAKEDKKLAGVWSTVHDHRGVNDEQSPLKPEYVTSLPRFEPGSPEAWAFLEEQGFVIIRAALTAEEASEALNLTWDYLEKLGTGVDRKDPSTWDDDRWPTVVHGGILSFHGVGQSEAQWYIRGKERVKRAFAGVWGTDDLLTSFDGMALNRPWKMNPAWKTNPSASWLHIDQHPITRPGFHCVQGLVNLLPMDETSGGNVLIPKSHHDFPNIPSKYPDRLAKVPKHIDHFRYPPNDPLLVSDAPEKPIMCHLEVGDLLLWDSRTIHCSAPSLREPAEARPELMRAVSLICMMPSSRCPEDVRQLRKTAPLELKSTTNWSDRWINLDESPVVLYHQDLKKYPDKNGYKYNLVSPPRLTPEQLLLVGYTEQEIRAGDYPYMVTSTDRRAKL